MSAMRGTRLELIEGLGLSVLAVLFTGALLTAAFVAAGKGFYLRAAAFGVPGLVAAYWTVRFTWAQIAGYRGSADG